MQERKNKIGCQSVATVRHKPQSAVPRCLSSDYENCGWKLICDWIWNNNLGQTSAQLMPPKFLQTCSEHKEGLQSFFMQLLVKLSKMIPALSLMMQDQAVSGFRTEATSLQPRHGLRDTWLWVLWCSGPCTYSFPLVKTSPLSITSSGTLFFLWVPLKKETWSL